MGARGRKSRAELATVADPVERSNVTMLPPRSLGRHGKALWTRIVAEYRVESSAAAELLCQACQSLDRAEACSEAIATEGLMIGGREHPLVKHELQARAFTSRIIQRLELEL